MSTSPNANVTSAITPAPGPEERSGPGTVTARWRRPLTHPYLLTVIGMAVAAGLVISRRPDAVIHAQFWAEDGKYYYANVYNQGLLRSLIVPQAGYFETFQLLAARVAEIFPLTAAPFVMNLLALVVQVLPVGLLLSPRAEAIAADIRVRAVLALLYLVVPSVAEISVNVVNAQWHLAVAALIVLMLAPPKNPWWRCLDAAILLMAGLTGPFGLLLAPLAWFQRYVRGRSAVPLWAAGLLTACAVLQVASTLVISHHPLAGPLVEPRPTPGLGATAALLAKLVGGRLLIGAVLGQSDGLSASLTLQWIALIVGAVGCGLILRFGRQELRLVLLFGVGLLAAALIDPTVPTPAWPILALGAGAAPRYYFIPDLAVLAALVWLAFAIRFPVVRVMAGALIVLAVVLVAAGHWSYPPFVSTPFAAEAHAFERAPRGTVATLALNPPGWTMSLLKR